MGCRRAYSAHLPVLAAGTPKRERAALGEAYGTARHGKRWSGGSAGRGPREGTKLGKLQRVYGDGDPPRWGAVKPGRLGRSHVVPLADARSDGREIRLAATKPQVNDAPRARGGDTLSPELEHQLRRHYHEPAAAREGKRKSRGASIVGPWPCPRSRGAALDRSRRHHLWNLQQPEVFNRTVADFVDRAEAAEV
jgi:hypothetical protein